MQVVPTLSGEVNTFFDDGSTCCLILLSTAKRLGLRGEDVVLTLKTVNGDENLETKLFCLSLVDSSNLRHPIKAFGVPNISGIITRPDLRDLRQAFSLQTQGMWDKIESRPVGEVEVLVGANYMGLHPVDYETSGNMKIKKSIFGSGLVAVGCHESVKSGAIKWDVTVSCVRSKASINFTRVSYKSVRDYLESNDLAVPTPRRCKNCINCNDCSFRGH